MPWIGSFWDASLWAVWGAAKRASFPVDFAYFGLVADRGDWDDLARVGGRVVNVLSVRLALRRVVGKYVRTSH